MIVSKVTIGFVYQEFDTEKNEFVNQEFFASEEVIIEDENGEPIDESSDEYNAARRAYLPFEMVQPKLSKVKKPLKTLTTISNELKSSKKTKKLSHPRRDL